MASVYNPDEVISMMVVAEETMKRDDLVAGNAEGLEDFIEGRFKHFKTDEEMEAYLMSL